MTGERGQHRRVVGRGDPVAHQVEEAGVDDLALVDRLRARRRPSGRGSRCPGRRSWSAAGSTGSSDSGPLVVTVQSSTLRCQRSALSSHSARQRRASRAPAPCRRRPRARRSGRRSSWASSRTGSPSAPGASTAPAARSPRRGTPPGTRRPCARPRQVVGVVLADQPGQHDRERDLVELQLAPDGRALRRRSSAGTSRPASAARRRASRRCGGRRRGRPWPTARCRTGRRRATRPGGRRRTARTGPRPRRPTPTAPTARRRGRPG